MVKIILILILVFFVLLGCSCSCNKVEKFAEKGKCDTTLRGYFGDSSDYSSCPPKCEDLNTEEDCEADITPKYNTQCCFWRKIWTEEEKETCLKKLKKKEPKYDIKNNEGKPCPKNSDCNGIFKFEKRGNSQDTICGHINYLSCKCFKNDMEKCDYDDHCLSNNCVLNQCVPKEGTHPYM